MPALRVAPLAALAGVALVAIAAIEAMGGREPRAAGEEAGYRLLPQAPTNREAAPSPLIVATPLPAQLTPTAAPSIWSTPAEFAPPD